MIIDITGRHASLNEPVRQHVHDRLEHVLRHANDLVSVHVILDTEKTRQMAEIVVHGRHLTATVHAESEDIYVSIDRCAEKLKHQLNHHLGRVRDRRRRQAARAEAELAAMAASSTELTEEATETELTEPEPETAAPAGPNVIRASATDLVPMTVEEAQRRLASAEHPFVIFRDQASLRLSVLYLRGDGNHGLIETSGG